MISRKELVSGNGSNVAKDNLNLSCWESLLMAHKVLSKVKAVATEYEGTERIFSYAVYFISFLVFRCYSLGHFLTVTAKNGHQVTIPILCYYDKKSECKISSSLFLCKELEPNLKTFSKRKCVFFITLFFAYCFNFLTGKRFDFYSVRGNFWRQ